MDPHTFVEEEDPFQFMLDDRNSSPPIEETLAAALLRLNDPKCAAILFKQANG